LHVPAVTTERRTLALVQVGSGGAEQKMPAHGSPTQAPPAQPLAQGISIASFWQIFAVQARTRELTSVIPSLQKNGAGTQSTPHTSGPRSNT